MASAAAEGYVRTSGTSSSQALQEVLDRAVGAWRYAAEKADLVQEDEFWVSKVDAQGNTLVEPNKWAQLEIQARQEVAELAGLMSKLGLAERAVRVEEARAALVIGAIRDAARDAGIPAGQVKALGAALRERLEQAEPVAVEQLRAA